MGFFDIFKKKSTTATPAESGAAVDSSAVVSVDEVAEQEQKQAELQAGLEKTKTGFFSKLARAVAGRSTVDADVLDELEEAGLIFGFSSDAKSEIEHYLPAMAISQLSVGHLLSTLESHGCEDFKIDHTKEFSSQWSTFIGHKEEMYTKTNEILLKDL